jgi:lipoate-protein ligase B
MKKTGDSPEDALILTEHESVYTLGKGATMENLRHELSSYDSVYRVERGGEVTWHGPGMLMIYPVMNLNRHQRSLRWYVTSLEEVVIRALSTLGIRGERSHVNNGVWVGDNKIAAVGISVSSWITMHGIALNIDCDLSKFKTIVPCGIADPSKSNFYANSTRTCCPFSLPKLSDKNVCRIKDFNVDIESGHVKSAVLHSLSELFSLDLRRPIEQHENCNTAVDILRQISVATEISETTKSNLILLK